MVKKQQPKSLTASQKRAKLKVLSATISRSLFEALAIASDLLKDHEYVDSFGGETALRDHMEEEEFRIFGGDPSLEEMLKAYRANPRKSEWAKYRHNIRAMIALVEPSAADEDSEPKVKKHDWVKTANELASRVADLEAENGQLKQTAADYQQQFQEKSAQLDEALRTVARLEGRIQELERHLGLTEAAA